MTKCVKCGEHKPDSEYYSQSYGRGLQKTCKECKGINTKKHSMKNNLTQGEYYNPHQWSWWYQSKVNSDR